MCNEYGLAVDIASIAEDFYGLRIEMLEGTPKVASR